MVSKKKKRIILISILSFVLIAVIAISSIFIVKNSKDKKNKSNVPTSQNVSQTDTNGINKDILDKKVSSNYNGTYVFNTIKDIEFSDKLNATEIRALYKNKNVSNKNELFDLLKKEKLSEKETGERIIIYNGNINKVIEKDNISTPIEGTEGYFYGNDDLSEVTITNTNETFFISLHYKSKDAAVVVSEKTSTNGTKLYVMRKIYSKYDPTLVLINITYEYDLLVIEEELDESIYDFEI